VFSSTCILLSLNSGASLSMSCSILLSLFFSLAKSKLHWRNAKQVVARCMHGHTTTDDAHCLLSRTLHRKGNHEVAVDFKVPPKRTSIEIFPFKRTDESFDPNIATVPKLQEYQFLWKSFEILMIQTGHGDCSSVRPICLSLWPCLIGEMFWFWLL